MKDDLVHYDAITGFSDDMDKAFTRLLEVTTIQQRKMAIDIIFDLLYSSEYETFVDLAKNLSKSLPKILRKYKAVSKEDKKEVTNIIKIIAKTYINSFTQRKKNYIINKINKKDKN